MRMGWGWEQEPALGDVAIEEPVERRARPWSSAFEEHRDSPLVWWLILERIAWPAVAEPSGELWYFHRCRR